MRAADAEIGADRLRLIGTIGQVHVLRWPYAVTITDSRDPAVHSGWTTRSDQARTPCGPTRPLTITAPHPSDPRDARGVMLTRFAAEREPFQ